MKEQPSVVKGNRYSSWPTVTLMSPKQICLNRHCHNTISPRIQIIFNACTCPVCIRTSSSVSIAPTKSYSYKIVEYSGQCGHSSNTFLSLCPCIMRCNAAGSICLGCTIASTAGYSTYSYMYLKIYCVSIYHCYCRLT